MSRGAHPFTQAAITRAIKGAVQAGMRVRRVEIASDKITVFAGAPEAGAPEAGAPPTDVNEWDSVK